MKTWIKISGVFLISIIVVSILAGSGVFENISSSEDGGSWFGDTIPEGEGALSIAWESHSEAGTYAVEHIAVYHGRAPTVELCDQSTSGKAVMRGTFKQVEKGVAKFSVLVHSETTDWAYIFSQQVYIYLGCGSQAITIQFYPTYYREGRTYIQFKDRTSGIYQQLTSQYKYDTWYEFEIRWNTNSSQYTFLFNGMYITENGNLAGIPKITEITIETRSERAVNYEAFLNLQELREVS